LLAQASHLGDFMHAHILGEGEQSMEAFDEPKRAAGIGLLETARELLACEGAEVEGKGHERTSFGGKHVAIRSDRNAVSLVICPAYLALKTHESFSERL
jgi:hypothetical protein